MVNFCPKCGEKLDSIMKFCPKCGSTIEDEDIPVSMPQYQQPQAPVQPQYGYGQGTGQTYPQRPVPRVGSSPQQGYYPRSYNTGNGNKRGGAALACGILGCCCSYFFGMILGIVAIVLGAVGLKQDEKPGLAVAGILFGIINIALFFLFFGSFSSWLYYF